MKVEIKSRWSSSILFAIEAGSFKAAVELAVKGGADLSWAELSGANLSGAYLSGAELRGANLRGAYLSGAELSGAELSGANLSGANLSGAYLSWAELSGANLSGAYLSGADLSWANLSWANLSGADLSWAELSGANLSGAYLSGAYLDEIKHDLWAVLTLQPREVLGLRQALIDGKVDGSTYDGGGCHCLVGTIADVAGRDYKELDRLKPDADRPIERWFLGIKPGDTPDSNQIAELALEWIDEWLSTPVGRLFDADSAASNQQEADRA